MQKVKPNLRKMFNFHTIILVIFVIVVSTLHTHTSEGKLQRPHKHHHNHNNRHHNIKASDDDRQWQHGHNNHHHSLHHHQQTQDQYHKQKQKQKQQQHYDDATTPSFEFTTSSSSSLSSSYLAAAISNDNEFLIKQEEEQPLINKDEIYYKTKKDFQSSTTASTTSKPALSIHLMKPQNNHNLKATSIHVETLSDSKQEHTHHSQSHSHRLTSTPLNKAESHSGIDKNHTANSAKIYSEGREYKYSNLNLTTRNDEDANIDEQPVQHQQRQSHNKEKKDFVNEQQRPQQNYEDYYSDAEDDEIDDDGDDDYSEDEGDNDGISYDDDKNLSDRSYARITRSKLDDDYIDDEPYRNGINELGMQRDAAPGLLTEQKYLDVGNEKAVQQARERYMQEQKRPRTPHELATEHWHRMIQATKCRKPLPRVIPVSNNTSKRYEPYATILHRCGDDTGCCGSTASICTVRRHEIVMVYVFSYDFNYRKEIEALPMQNHTECHCVNRGSLLHDSMPRDKRSGSSIGYLHHFHRQHRKQQQQQQQYRQSESPSYAQHQFHHQQQLQNMLDCQCPRHFNVFEEDVEHHVHLPKPHSVFIRKCRCDCLVNNQTCLRFKHGEEGFSLEDRKCILERKCKPPACLYGDYNLRVGRCPSYRSHPLQTT